jgi:hypothetical protein
MKPRSHGRVVSTPTSYYGERELYLLRYRKPNVGFSWFSSVPPGKCGKTASFHILFNSLFIAYHNIRRVVSTVRLAAS